MIYNHTLFKIDQHQRFKKVKCSKFMACLNLWPLKIWHDKLSQKWLATPQNTFKINTKICTQYHLNSILEILRKMRNNCFKIRLIRIMKTIQLRKEIDLHKSNSFLMIEIFSKVPQVLL